MAIPKKVHNFGILLANAIAEIARRKSISIKQVEDEIGRALGKSGQHTLRYWRRGNVPRVDMLNSLLEILVNREGLDQQGLAAILQETNHPFAEQQLNKHFPAAQSSTPGAANAGAPPPMPSIKLPLSRDLLLQSKTYSQLVGRTALLDDMMKVLNDRKGNAIIGVDGIGGMGKTALVIEAALSSVSQHMFDAVVWASAGPTTVAGLDVPTTASAQSFEGVVTAVIEQLAQPNPEQEHFEKKLARVRGVLKDNRVLLILDNLETAPEPQDKLAQKLGSILGSSKALLTSRRRFKSGAFGIHPIRLQGLDLPGTRQFMEQLGPRGKEAQALGDSALKQIADATGGSPLALKLVAGQLAYLDLDIILGQLAPAKLPHSQPDDEYTDLYRGIYLPAWSVLSEAAKGVLLIMATLAPADGGTLEDIARIGKITKTQAAACMRELWMLSLVEVADPGDTPAVSMAAGSANKRYYLHPLTEQFVQSDIAKPSDEAGARPAD